VPRSTLPSTIKKVTVSTGTCINPEHRNAYCKQSVQDLMKKRLLCIKENCTQCRVEVVDHDQPQPSPRDALSVWLSRSHD
jgi:ferredoxin